jgi:DNA-3-methyladenine glycosylase I
VSSYCEFAKGHELHGPYHDHEYGFPVEDESQLFERLLLEINQAGLNWELILKKRKGFREAYDDFDVDRVADYSQPDRERLLTDARIIRNELKVNAAIVNAQVIRGMRDSHGGFAHWL